MERKAVELRTKILDALTTRDMLCRRLAFAKLGHEVIYHAPRPAMLEERTGDRLVLTLGECMVEDFGLRTRECLEAHLDRMWQRAQLTLLAKAAGYSCWLEPATVEYEIATCNRTLTHLRAQCSAGEPEWREALVMHGRAKAAAARAIEDVVED